MDSAKFLDVLRRMDDSLSSNELYDFLQSEFPELTRECIRSRVRRFKANQNLNTLNKEIVMSNKPINVSNNDVTLAPGENITKSVEYKSDGSAIFERIICLRDSEQLTPDKILEAHGMDPNLWEVLSCKSNFYQQQRKGGTVLNLYQSKVSAKPVQNAISFDQIKKMFYELQSTFVPHECKKPNPDAHYMYEINIADLHLGRFSTEEETGDFLNTDLAERRFFELIDAECEKIAQYNGSVEKILFVWTNDFFNSDGISNATTGGTPQDTELKWQKLYVRGVNMLIRAIDKLSTFAPVKTFYIASNHSRQVDYYAICTLQAWFRNYSNVEIDIDPSPRYYERYGVNLIGFAHSYYEKKQNLPHLMQIERAKDWGDTKYREYHLAHYHSEKVEEKGGIVFRWLPSMTGADTWSTDCGYIGAVKRSYSFVYDKYKGLVQMNSTIID